MCLDLMIYIQMCLLADFSYRDLMSEIKYLPAVSMPTMIKRGRREFDHTVVLY